MPKLVLQIGADGGAVGVLVFIVLLGLALFWSLDLATFVLFVPWSRPVFSGPKAEVGDVSLDAEAGVLPPDQVQQGSSISLSRLL